MHSCNKLLISCLFLQEKKCTSHPKKSCHDVAKKIPSSHPKKVCNKKPKQKCHSVPQQVPEKGRFVDFLNVSTIIFF